MTGFLTTYGFETAKGRRFDIPVVVLFFLTLDIFFLGLNVVWNALSIVGIAGERWDLIKIRNDYGLPEISNFLKYLCVSGLLTIGVLSKDRRNWLPMAAAFFLLFLDDAFRIHENVSTWIGLAYFQEVAGPGKPAITIGQLPYYLVFGILVFGGALLTLRRVGSCQRQPARRLVVLLLALSFFAAGVDFINSFILESLGKPWLGSLGSLIENGAELIILSLCVWVAFDARAMMTGPAPDG